jgi:hypothetical protein
MAKKSKGRSDAATTRKMQADVNRRMRDALAMSGDASAGIREGMDYGRFPGTAGDRMRELSGKARRTAKRLRKPSRRKEGVLKKKKGDRSNSNTPARAQQGQCCALRKASRVRPAKRQKLLRCALGRCPTECPPVSPPRLARRRAPQEQARLRQPPRATNLYRALLGWQSEQTCAKPWTLLMPRSAPPSVKPPTVRWA